MKHKKNMIFLATVLSICFSLIYLAIFHFYIPQEDQKTSMTIYTDQIGLYKKEENAKRMANQLKEQGLSSYVYFHDDVYTVVSGISIQEEMCEKNEALLKKNSYSYLRKTMTITDSEIIALIKAQEYEKALELIGNQSERNASAGATTGESSS